VQAALTAALFFTLILCNNDNDDKGEVEAVVACLAATQNRHHHVSRVCVYRTLCVMMTPLRFSFRGRVNRCRLLLPLQLVVAGPAERWCGSFWRALLQGGHILACPCSA
jgi:hypothetical protein